jgi:hypothetical protein
LGQDPRPNSIPGRRPLHGVIVAPRPRHAIPHGVPIRPAPFALDFRHELAPKIEGKFWRVQKLLRIANQTYIGGRRREHLEKTPGTPKSAIAARAVLRSGVPPGFGFDHGQKYRDRNAMLTGDFGSQPLQPVPTLGRSDGPTAYSQKTAANHGGQ